jgi:hypothetical protein
MATTVGPSSVLSPSPASYHELRRYVVDFLQGANDPELLSVAGRAINSAIDFLNTSRHWIKITGKQDITTTLAVADYALNTDFRDPIELVLMNIRGYPQKRLPYKPYKTLSLENPDGTQDGTPAFYTIYYTERLFSLNRGPVQGWVNDHPYMRLRYHKRLSRMTDDSASHGGPPEFDAYIGWRARWDVAATRGEPQLALMARNEAERALAMLTTSDNEVFTDWDE